MWESGVWLGQGPSWGSLLPPLTFPDNPVDGSSEFTELPGVASSLLQGAWVEGEHAGGTPSLHKGGRRLEGWRPGPCTP